MHKKDISLVIYSKDRAAQLESLLWSLSQHHWYNQFVRIDVIFRCAKTSLASYEQLKHEYSRINFIPETNFRHQTLKCLSKNITGYVMFLVDDCYFKRDFYPEIFNSVTPRTIVYTRLGADIDYSLNLDQKLTAPLFSKKNGLLQFKLKNKEAEFDYPWSLDGNIFPTYIILIISLITCFKNPNRFEHYMTKFRFLGKLFRNLCTISPMMTNVSLNVTQEEHQLTVSADTYPIEYLDIQRTNGYKIRFNLSDLPDNQTHVIVNPVFSKQDD